jgi:hypothetical protein
MSTKQRARALPKTRGVMISSPRRSPACPCLAELALPVLLHAELKLCTKLNVSYFCLVVSNFGMVQMGHKPKPLNITGWEEHVLIPGVCKVKCSDYLLQCISANKLFSENRFRAPQILLSKRIQRT